MPPPARDLFSPKYTTHTLRSIYSFAELVNSSDNDLFRKGGALKPVGDSSNDTGTSYTAEVTKAGCRCGCGCAAPPDGSATGAGSYITASSPACTVLAHEESPESTTYGVAVEVDFERARAAPPAALARRLLRMGKPAPREKPPRLRARFPPPLQSAPGAAALLVIPPPPAARAV